MTIEAALRPLIDGLEADGYRALVRETGSGVLFEITAGPDACEDCLSPRPVMERLIQHCLQESGLDTRVLIKYPNE